MTELIIGKAYEIIYPFIKCSYELYEDDGEGNYNVEKIDSWRPGCELHMEPCGEYVGDEEAYADSEGVQLLEVISIHKPGKYPERVFYTRKWKTPEGKIFGKPGLKITTRQNFKRMLKGYRYDYTIDN